MLILIFLVLSLVLLVFKPLIPLIMLKIKLGKEAKIYFFPIIGEFFYMHRSYLNYGNSLSFYDELARKHPNLKVILSNIYFSPVITFL